MFRRAIHPDVGLYLGYCEAAFLDRHIGDVQLLLAKVGTRRVLFGDLRGQKNGQRTTQELAQNDEANADLDR